MATPLRAASARISAVSLGLLRVTPDWRRNSGPSIRPVAATRASSAVTAHSMGSPDGVMRIVAPERKGSVLEHLICTRYPSVDRARSLCCSARSSWLLRKPKKTRSMAAQRMVWS